MSHMFQVLLAFGNTVLQHYAYSRCPHSTLCINVFFIHPRLQLQSAFVQQLHKHAGLAN